MILTAADEDTALAVEVLPGQAGDAPRLEPLLRKTLPRASATEELVGDTGFDGDAQRASCIERGVVPVIPNHPRRTDPWPFDRAAYRERNRVERLFAKLKQFRRVATRYEKLAVMFRGVVHLALSFIRLRRIANVNTT